LDANLVYAGTKNKFWPLVNIFAKKNKGQ
jgi:hypothetical protein